MTLCSLKLQRGFPSYLIILVSNTANGSGDLRSLKVQDGIMYVDYCLKLSLSKTLAKNKPPG